MQNIVDVFQPISWLQNVDKIKLDKLTTESLWRKNRKEPIRLFQLKK